MTYYGSGDQSRAATRSRNGLRPGIADAGMSAAREWYAIAQAAPDLNLETLIELAGQRRSTWPILAEFWPISNRPDPRGKRQRNVLCRHETVCRGKRRGAYLVGDLSAERCR